MLVTCEHAGRTALGFRTNNCYRDYAQTNAATLKGLLTR